MPREGVVGRIRSTAARVGVSRGIRNAHGAADGLGWVLERRIAPPRGRLPIRCSRHGGPRVHVSAEHPGSSSRRRHHDRRPHPIAGTATPRPGSDRRSLGGSRAANPPRGGLRIHWQGHTHASNPAGRRRPGGALVAKADAEPPAGCGAVFRGGIGANLWGRFQNSWSVEAAACGGSRTVPPRSPASLRAFQRARRPVRSNAALGSGRRRTHARRCTGAAGPSSYPQGERALAWWISFSTSNAASSLPYSQALALSSLYFGKQPS